MQTTTRDGRIWARVSNTHEAQRLKRHLEDNGGNQGAVETLDDSMRLNAFDCEVPCDDCAEEFIRLV